MTPDNYEVIADALREMAEDFRRYDPSVGIFSNDETAEYIDGLASDVEGQELERIRNESSDRKNRIKELEEDLAEAKRDNRKQSALLESKVLDKATEALNLRCIAITAERDRYEEALQAIWDAECDVSTMDKATGSVIKLQKTAWEALLRRTL